MIYGHIPRKFILILTVVNHSKLRLDLFAIIENPNNIEWYEENLVLSFDEGTIVIKYTYKTCLSELYQPVFINPVPEFENLCIMSN